MEYEESAVPSSNEGIGIDLGIKDLSACSDEHKYPNINKTQVTAFHIKKI
jgi:transposase